PAAPRGDRLRSPGRFARATRVVPRHAVPHLRALLRLRARRARRKMPALMDDRGFLEALIGDGRPLLNLVALTLIGSGAFAIFQAASGGFLPQDVAFLGMSAEELCSMQGCRILHFMVHDRVSFGGVMIATGILYLWLSEFPLRSGESWAWWALLVSGASGFLSFLAYLGYGYLDTWHGAATLALLPLFIGGLWRTR